MQTPTHLVFIFEFVPGGEIFRLLRSEGGFPNDVALFYITQVALAIDHLHESNIAYRDLKPENLLVGSDGCVKLTDFGFAKVISER